MRLCAVVPAAGRGTRLGGALPKLLAPLGGGATIWSVLSQKLLALADHICLVVSPAGLEPVREVVERGGLSERVSIIIQPAPIGMGDAIFRAVPIWSKAQAILVVWGDQVFVSDATLRRAWSLYRGDSKTIALPLVAMPHPYVEYCFDASGRLNEIKQTREGDHCSASGYADLGTFVISVEGLAERWHTYLRAGAAGALTGEVNFLPFLPWLASHGWAVRRFTVADAREARGINTPDDLAFFRSLLHLDSAIEETPTR
jgi:bifunctional N-acetylglucosamine-1-phosphate-uridyltransferase/glucosamine-1-phosphate-acetyltransferase GlmU-like protein